MRLWYTALAPKWAFSIRKRCMSVDAATVRRIAHLARIAVAEDEVESLQAELNAILAFVDPTAENEAKLLSLAGRAREATGCVVTHGFGPRYLHSTGQLHKGGPPTGLFLQVVDDTGDELPIPNQPFGFGKLIRAQAAGDYALLEERGWRIARIRLEEV